MKIVRGTPPNFETIKAVLPDCDRPGVIFTYGDTVYVIGGDTLTPELKAHEAVHIKQQLEYPGGPAAWWAEYLSNRDFRLSQERPAHLAEYMACPSADRNRKALARSAIATRLSSPLYGSLMSYGEALRYLR